MQSHPVDPSSIPFEVDNLDLIVSTSDVDNIEHIVSCDTVIVDAKSNNPMVKNIQESDLVGRKPINQNCCKFFFLNNLQMKIPPRRGTCLKFLEEFSVKNRTWKEVKAMIFN